MDSLYKILDAKPDDSKEIIKKKYRTKIKNLHPDNGGTCNNFSKIKQAFAILSDDEKRKQYDNGELTDDIDDAEMDLKYQVEKTITALFFNNMLDNNILSTSKKQINDHVSNLKKKIISIQNSINMFTTQYDYVYRKDDKENLYQCIIKQKINTLQAELQFNQKELKLFTVVLEELKNYFELPKTKKEYSKPKQ